MSIDQNKALVRRFIDEVFLRGCSRPLTALSDDFTATRGFDDAGQGRPEAGDHPGVGRARPDATMTIEDVIDEDDRVAVRLTSHAVQVGPFMGWPLSGRAYTSARPNLPDPRRQDRGHLHQADFLGMMRQLGVLPGPG